MADIRFLFRGNEWTNLLTNSKFFVVTVITVRSLLNRCSPRRPW